MRAFKYWFKYYWHHKWSLIKGMALCLALSAGFAIMPFLLLGHYFICFLCIAIPFTIWVWDSDNIEYKKNRNLTAPLLTFDTLKTQIQLNPEAYTINIDNANDCLADIHIYYCRGNTEIEIAMPSLWEAGCIYNDTQEASSRKRDFRLAKERRENTEKLLMMMKDDMQKIIDEENEASQTALENFEKIVQNTP